jgi:hypothetical protein
VYRAREVRPLTSPMERIKPASLSVHLHLSKKGKVWWDPESAVGKREGKKMHPEELGVDATVILKFILRENCVEWIHLVQDTDRQPTVRWSQMWTEASLTVCHGANYTLVTHLTKYSLFYNQRNRQRNFTRWGPAESRAWVRAHTQKKKETRCIMAR